MKTAAAYIRVSTDDQLEFSPDSQKKAVLAYAKQHEMILPEEFIFTDEGISGRSAKRPAFQKMIGVAKLKPKLFDVILVWKFSRFARNREDSIVYKSMLRKQCDIDVISVSEPIGEDKTSVLIEALLVLISNTYNCLLINQSGRENIPAGFRNILFLICAENLSFDSVFDTAIQPHKGLFNMR